MDASGMGTAGEGLNEQSVRERAYFIWENEGKPHGRDREHWTRAERELFSPGTMASSAAPATAKAASGGAVKSAANDAAVKKPAAETRTAAKKAPGKRMARVTKPATKSGSKPTRSKA